MQVCLLRSASDFSPVIHSLDKITKGVVEHYDPDIATSCKTSKRTTTSSETFKYNKDIDTLYSKLKIISGSSSLSEEDPFTPYIEFTPHQVKDNEKLVQLLIDNYKRGYKFLRSFLKTFKNNSVGNAEESLFDKYKTHFLKFAEITRNRTLTSTLEINKVALNITAYSSKLVAILVNGVINGEVRRRVDNDLRNVVQQDLYHEINSYYIHACKEFGVCRAAQGFTNFIENVLEEILKEDDKLKQFYTAFIELVKQKIKKNKPSYVNPSLLKIIEVSLDNEKTYSKVHDKLLLQDIKEAIGSGIDFKSNILNPRKLDAIAKLMENFEKDIPVDRGTIKEWNKFLNNLSAWRAGRRSNINNIIEESFQSIQRRVEQWDRAKWEQFFHKLKILLHLI